MRITLEPYEMEWAYTVGMRRHSANASKGDAPHYDPARMEDNLRASIAAACGEIATAKALGRYWPGSAWDSSQHYRHAAEPDVYPNVEVRRVREPGNPLVVRRRDVENGRNVVVCYPDPSAGYCSIDVIGWLPSGFAWTVGRPAVYDVNNTRLVDQHYLYDLAHLAAGGTDE